MTELEELENLNEELVALCEALPPQYGFITFVFDKQEKTSTGFHHNVEVEDALMAIKRIAEKFHLKIAFKQLERKANAQASRVD